MPMIAEQQHVSVGDSLQVTGAHGPVTCTVAGVGSTYVGASLISGAAADDFAVTDPMLLMITPRIESDATAVLADLTAIVEETPHTEISDMERMVEMQMLVVEALPLMLNALLLLATVTAALGVINTTVISVTERRRELGLLRAIGATQRQVRGVVTGEAALVGLLGGAIGVLGGLGFIVILATTYGGNAWGITDLDVWAAAGRAIRPALINSLFGLIAAPLVSALAAWIPTRVLLRGSALDLSREV